MWINSFPAVQGISKILSPSEIVLNRSLIFERHSKDLFGLYIETNEDGFIKKSNRGWTFPVIILGPTGHIQGTQNVFMSKLTRQQNFTGRNIPMPQAVIKYVHDWAKNSVCE